METDFRFQTHPYAHQLEAFLRSKDAPVFAYIMDMGTGKSKVTVDNMAYLHEIGEIDLGVILAPKGVHAQWVHEQFPKHWPQRLAMRSWLFYSHKKPPSWVFDRRPNQMSIVCMNIESMSHDSGKQFLRKLLQTHGNRSFLAVDESSRIKTPNATRTKTLRTLGRQAGYRRILTGTPVTQGLQDLYAQYAFLDPDIIGVSTYEGFKQRYCDLERPHGRNVPVNAYVITGYRNTEELLSRVGRVSFSVTKDECLDLPPKVYMTREVEMSDVQARHYKDLKKHALTVLQSGELVTPMNALEMLLRLHQIVCGHLKGELITPCPRVTALGDVVEEAGKTIVWSRFKVDIHRICAELQRRGIEHVVHTGDVDTKDREVAIKRFMEDPNVRAFVATTDSGGIGLNLTAATTVVYYSNAFSLEKRLQSEDRAHRIGQTKSVTYVDLVTPDTVDTRIVDALKAKQDIASMALETLRATVAG